MLLLSLALVPLLLLPAASGANIYLDKHSGDGFDIWLPPGEPQPNELLIVVNYADSSMILKIEGDQYTIHQNKTYLTLVLPAHSSQLVEAQFSDVETHYTVSLEIAGQTVFSKQLSRGSYMLPPPQASWTWKPPESLQDPKLYTDGLAGHAQQHHPGDPGITTWWSRPASAWAAASSLDEVLVPMDLASAMGCTPSSLDFAFAFTGEWDRLWYMPFLAGYVMGFFIWHIPYIMPMLIDSESKSLTVRPQVIYYPEDRNKPCIQAQSNKALVARWLGIHHELRTDGPLAADWSMHIKKPYLPKIRAPGLWVQKSVTDKETIERLRIKWAKLHTKYILANASRMPHYLWLQTSKAFYELSDRLEYSENARVKDRLTRAAETTAMASDLITHSQMVSHHEAIERFKKDLRTPEEISLNEHELNVIEEAETEIPEETEQAELQETEKQRPAEAPKKAAKGSNEAKKGKRKVKE
jgi:hypothetical protein